jgi:hypothetical protein
VPEILEWSIRDLVPNPDLPHRRGHDSRFSHQIIQARYRRKYRSFRSEVELVGTINTESGTVVVSGRIDGCRQTRGGVVLYEIKQVPGAARAWRQSPALNRARWQLKLYAALAVHARTKPWQTQRVHSAVLILAGTDGSVVEEPVELIDADGLLHSRLQTKLDRSPAAPDYAARLAQLHSFIAFDEGQDRPIQREAVAALQRCGDATRILLALPPGSGKTRVALRTALLRASQSGLPLYWITEKAAGREEVLRELSRYTGAGIALRVLWKTTAQRLCECETSPELCPVRYQTEERLFRSGLPAEFRGITWNPEQISAAAAEPEICPWELSQSLEPMADVIVADLSYLLHPSSLRRRNAVIVLDEAQNIGDRILSDSEVGFTREDLRSACAGLTSKQHADAAPLLDRAEWSAENAEELRERWLRFAHSLDDHPAAADLRKSAWLWESFPDDYAITWAYDGGRWKLIGTLRNAAPLAEGILQDAAAVIALSGSLSADPQANRTLFPLYHQFVCAETGAPNVPVVRFVPLLEFKHPLTNEDHSVASEAIQRLRQVYGASVAVYGQNRASNEMLAWHLRVRGLTTWLDSDIGDDWSTVAVVKPDVIFFALGGRLAEAVNPPDDLFSCAAVLSPGHRAVSLHEQLRRHQDRLEDPPDDFGESPPPSSSTIMATAVSRIVQAAGRLQRSPHSRKPVFMLNQDFVRPDYCRQWPPSWYRKTVHELIHPSLDDAINSIDALVHTP